MAVTTMVIPGGTVRSGPGYWLDSYRAMTRWELTGLRSFLPAVVAVQILAGVGLVLGVGIFIPGTVPPRAALFVSTGVPVINLYLLGMVVMPQVVGQQRMADTYDFMQSLPVPKVIDLLSWLTVTVLAGLPGMVASLLAARWRYGFQIHVSAGMVTAVVLVALTATAVGAVLAHAISQPMVTMALTQVLNFVAIGFAPVAFPPEQLPGWLVSVNHVLPFESMAVTMRAGLTADPVAEVPKAYLVLVVWSAACTALAVWALRRRG